MNLDRIQKLIALAGNNASEEEARTAAYLAVKAIRENKLVLLEPTDPRLALQTPRDPWGQGPFTRDAWGPPPPPRPRPAPRREPPPPPPPPPPPGPLPRKRITLQFPGWCTRCRARIAEGSFAWWRKGDGCVCPGCHETQEAA